MTEQERQQAFIQALQEAEQRYGFKVVSTLYVEGIGAVMPLDSGYIKPGAVSVVPIPNWQVPGKG
jgi:hypothetical protein